MSLLGKEWKTPHLTWRLIVCCPEVHPNGALCLVECPAEGAPHPGQHRYDEWEDGSPSYPVYWNSE